VTHIERAIHIERSPNEVFAVLTDLDRLPDWATVVIETREVSDRPLRAGCTFRQRIRVLGREIESEWRIADYDPPRTVGYEASAPDGGTLTMQQTVSPSDGGSEVKLLLDYELPGGVLGELLDRAVVEAQNEKEAERSLQRLKRLAEAGIDDPDRL
jgi:uncharacterized membrane protein